MMTILLSFLIGVFGGLRSLTAPAVTAWAVYLGWMKLERPFSLIGTLPAVVILTALALVELITDKLPKTPNRTSPPGLIARIVTGAITGACVAAGGGQAPLVGGVLGAIGGVVGCFAGYHARVRLARILGSNIYAALIEDVVAVAGCLWVVSRF
jgi:uncharacterized membrane protein